jgi:hypothetical protein
MGRLKVRVNGAWEEVAPPVVEEVVVSNDDPYLADPAATAELWYDPDGIRPPSSDEEVYVGPDDPDTIDPLNEVDLWYDPDDTSTGVPVLAIDDLTDVDTTTTPPTESQALGWSDAAANWLPQSVWKSWSGTQAEYDAIPTKDPLTLYAIV